MTGSHNTAVGVNAPINNTSGHDNLSAGINAGSKLTTGSNNIDIVNVGGGAGESNTIRIGTKGTHTATFIAGISGSGVAGVDVVVSATGQLGVLPSSVRYKHDIRDMGAASSSLMKLRPVTFKYKNDERGLTQYGLVAEEVEKVYPELVAYGDDGKVETIRYSVLTSDYKGDCLQLDVCSATGSAGAGAGRAARKPQAGCYRPIGNGVTR